MRYSYDVSTKDKEILYARLVDKYLLELGFGFNKNGTKYLRDLILTAYFIQDYEFFVEDTIEKFLDINKINMTKKNFLRSVQYSIESVDYNKTKRNFYSVFNVEYDYYYLTPKNLTILIISLLERTNI